MIGRWLRYAWRQGRAQRVFDAAMASLQARHFAAARRQLEEAVALEPRHSPAHRSLGVLLKSAGRPGEALPHLRQAYTLEPSAPGVLRELVVTLVELDRCEEALQVARERALAESTSYEAHLLTGFVHQKIGDPQAALRSYEAAAAVRADDPELYFNRGIAYQDLGRLAEACADYERTSTMSGEFPLARFHLALARLLSGDFERGWDGYEGRKIAGGLPSRTRALPAWDGSLAGRSLAIVREQGLGDEIMFASLFAEVSAAARYCLIECDPRLERLFRRSFPAATVCATEWIRHRSAAQVEAEVPAGDLPRLLRRQRSDFPARERYLHADPQRVAHWAGRLAQLGDGPKIGLSWTGGTGATRRSLRSIPLERLRPILDVPGMRFVSLQYTAEAAQEAAVQGITHWPEAIDDLDETAALICALDQMVSVCTAVVHLAGALGRPTWVLTPFSPEWRYGFSGETMPWYPSVRIFRQPAFAQWEPVIASVAAALRRAY